MARLQNCFGLLSAGMGFNDKEAFGKYTHIVDEEASELVRFYIYTYIYRYMYVYIYIYIYM